MLSVKIELLDALGLALEELCPGAGARAVFESPKVPEHGDLATTVAMQLVSARHWRKGVPEQFNRNQESEP